MLLCLRRRWRHPPFWRSWLRQLGIGAPEMSHCPHDRVCAPGDGPASKQSLVAAMRLGPVRYEPVTLDRYGALSLSCGLEPSTYPAGSSNSGKRLQTEVG